MADWRDLQTFLMELLGSKNVYFQPPTGYLMSYPAIVFTRKTPSRRFAGDSVYFRLPCYEVTVIDPSPDGLIAKKVEQIPYCAHDRNFKKDNLNHDTFTLYF